MIRLILRGVRSQLSRSTMAYAMERTLSMQQLPPEYVLGVVDGEGSFTVYVRDTGTSKLKHNRRVIVEPKFYIKLVGRDKKILESIQTFFGCGSIYFQKDTRPNHQQCYRYEVYRRDDLQNVIIPFFKKHPPRFATKKNDFLLFVKMMSAISRGEHLTQKGLMRLRELKQQMH